MEIKILGEKCLKCDKLAKRTREALDQMGLDCEIQRVSDPNEIATDSAAQIAPVLLVDGEVKVSGEVGVPTVEELKELL